MNILVFKTNIEDVKQVRKLSPHLSKVQGILKWNVDLHDRDKILRIEADDLLPHSIERILKDAGYYCAELDD